MPTRISTCRHLMLSIMASALAIISVSAGPALAQPQIGLLAPDFQAVDVSGAPQSLSQYRGKTIVLEWTNPECPFVVKHYASDNMQKLQKAATSQGIVWLSINSGAAGKQGHLTAQEATSYIAKHKAAQSAYIQDVDGTIGRLYDAKTTPHMFVIDAEGILVYAGAIDDKPSFDLKDIDGARNYVSDALNALQAGTDVATTTTRPYGCAVKYGDL